MKVAEIASDLAE